MTAATTLETIDVSALRVGMYVHLDLGWLSHPFPLSNFRIGNTPRSLEPPAPATCRVGRLIRTH